MSKGWVSIWRKIQEEPWYGKSAYVHLFIHLILEANHAPKTVMWGGQQTKIDRGTILTGRKQLSLATKIPETSIERILLCFESGHQIRQQKTTKFRLITLLKYNKYQDNRTLLRTTNGQQTDTNNNVNNVNNITPNGGKQKPMEEEIIEIGEDGEPRKVPSKKETFGRYPALIAKFYYESVNKKEAGQQLKAAKRLMQIATEEFPTDTPDQCFTEILGRIDIAKWHYDHNNVTEWNLAKVAENWNKVYSWKLEKDKYQ